MIELEPDPITGKRRQATVTARSQSRCREKLEALKAEIRTHGAPLVRETTVREWGERWLEEVVKPSRDPKTYTGYRGFYRSWLLPTLGAKRLADLKPSDVRAVHASVYAAGRSPSTARAAHVALSLMCKAAISEGLMRSNPTEAVEPPSPKTQQSRGALPELDAVALLQAAAEMPDMAGTRAWWRLLTGQRQGEILGARSEDLTLETVTGDDGAESLVGSYETWRQLQGIPRATAAGHRTKPAPTPAGTRPAQPAPRPWMTCLPGWSTDT